MLKNTCTSSSALRAKVWHSDGEVKLVSRGIAGVRGVVGPAFKRLTNGLVGGSIDDRDVSDTSMWCVKIKLHGNNLASCVSLDVLLVIFKLVPFAEVQVALGRIITVLRVCDLHYALEVPVLVRGLLAKSLRAAGSLQ